MLGIKLTTSVGDHGGPNSEFISICSPFWEGTSWHQTNSPSPFHYHLLPQIVVACDEFMGKITVTQN